MTKLTTYVALLRGINVGGKTMVSMADLKLIFERLGYQDVRTYINSGNIIFRSIETDLREIERTIVQAISEKLEMNIAVVVRSLAEMNELMGNLPKSWADSSDKKCNVIFLDHTIDKPGILEGLQIKEEIEELYYQPGVLMWSALTSDLTKSNMIKLSRHGVYQHMTARILNSVRKIYGIMQEIDGSSR